MIVPRTPLLVLTALVLGPLSLRAAAHPEATGALSLAAAAFVAIVALDALVARNRLDGVHAQLPELVRLSVDRPGEIDVTVSNQRLVGTLRLGLALPPELESPSETITTALGANAPNVHVAWPVTGLKRGRYEIENAYMEVASPFRLWAVRAVSPAHAEVRVYPNLLAERRHLAALFLNRGNVGIHAQRQIGKGRDFEKLREYVPGDSYEDVHWKATAKRGHPITKVFQLERTQEVYVAIDTSRLSARNVWSAADSSNGQTTLERFITAALILGLVAEKQGDLFGLLTFDSQVNGFVRARNGKTHYGMCRDALYTLQPRMVSPDYSELFTFLRLRLRRRALVMVLTSLDDPVLSEQFVEDSRIASRHHLLLVNMIKDPAISPLFSTPDVAEPDDVYQRLGAHIQWQKLREAEQTLRVRGISMGVLNNETLCPQLVSQYINMKRRQAI